jgi:hypothetical protein
VFFGRDVQIFRKEREDRGRKVRAVLLKYSASGFFAPLRMTALKDMRAMEGIGIHVS